MSRRSSEVVLDALGFLPRRLQRSFAGYPPTIRLLFVAQAFIATGNGALYPFLGLYVTDRFHVDIVVAGFVSSLFFACAAVASPVAGILADRLGRRPVILAALALDAVFIAGLGLAPSMPLVLLAVIGSGFSGSSAYPAIQAVVADIVPAERRSLVYGSMYQALGLGWFVGPVIATPLLARFGFSGVFAAATFLLASASIVLWRRLAETNRPVSAAPRAVGGRSFDERGALSVAPSGEMAGVVDLSDNGDAPNEKAVSRADDSTSGAASRDLRIEPEHAGGAADPQRWFTDRRLVAYVALHLCSFGAYIQLFNIFPVDGRDRLGLAADTWAAILAVNGAMILFGQPLVSRLASSVHKPFAVASGVLIWAIGFAFLGVIGSAALVLPAVVVLTLGEMTIFPIQPAVVAELAPAHARARYQGALTMGGSIGNAIAPTVGGLAVAALGGGWWIVQAVLLVLLAAGYVAFGRRVLIRPSTRRAEAKL